MELFPTLPMPFRIMTRGRGSSGAPSHFVRADGYRRERSLRKGLHRVESSRSRPQHPSPSNASNHMGAEWPGRRSHTAHKPSTSDGHVAGPEALGLGSVAERLRDRLVLPSRPPRHTGRRSRTGRHPVPGALLAGHEGVEPLHAVYQPLFEQEIERAIHGGRCGGAPCCLELVQQRIRANRALALEQ